MDSVPKVNMKINIRITIVGPLLHPASFPLLIFVLYWFSFL